MHWQVLCIASAFYRTLRKMALSYFDLRIFCFLFSNFVQWSLPLCGSSFNHLFFCNWSNCWTGFQRHDYREEIYRWEKTEDEETNWKSSYFVLWSSPWGSTYYVLPFKYTCLTAPWGRTYYVLRTAIKGFWNMINPLSSPPPLPPTHEVEYSGIRAWNKSPTMVTSSRCEVLFQLACMHLLDQEILPVSYSNCIWLQLFYIFKGSVAEQ